MRALRLLTAAGIMAVASLPAMADEMMMMKKGETVMVMPNGSMGTMATMDPMMAGEMMKAAKPMEHCMLMMMGADGKMYMMEDMKMANGMMACDEAAKSKM